MPTAIWDLTESEVGKRRTLAFVASEKAYGDIKALSLFLRASKIKV